MTEYLQYVPKIENVLCSDGEHRTAFCTGGIRTAGEIPARVNVGRVGKRYTVCGVVKNECGSPDGQPYFQANTDGKNYGILPESPVVNLRLPLPEPDDIMIIEME